jgi:phosphatidylglycerol:prolipoprotein diacylglycerol transferase
LGVGGRGIYGAVAGGALGLYIAARSAKQPLLKWMDTIVPGLVLAQAVGRWGNYINQELYGKPTNLPWAIYIEPRFRLPGFEMYDLFQPTFFYESMWNLATCLALVYVIWRYRDKLVPGLTTSVYFISYSVIRFLLEFIRLDAASVGPVPIAQIVAVVIILVFSGFLVYQVRKYRGGEPAPAELEAGSAPGQVPSPEEEDSPGTSSEA